MPIILAIVLTLGLGAVVGFFNGVLVGYIGLAALVVTIGMQSLLEGFQFAISPSNGISSGISTGFVSFARGTVVGIPYLVIVSAVVLLLLWILLGKTSLGRRMRAVGGNVEAARYAGLNVRAITLIAFVITAVMCAGAGILFAGQQGNVYPLQGLTVLLQAYAACFIGATMFRVGQFNIAGTAVGCVLAQVISNGLLLANVNTYAVYFFQGGILIAAVLLARVVIGAARTV
jgi:ribose/xylose/arabinose/galactoside ABC-type transport system permease subunit